MMPAYELTPVGADGPEPERAETVYGPDLDRIRLLLGQLDQAAAEIAGLEFALARSEEQVQVGERDRQRLQRAAAELSALARSVPALGAYVERMRDRIWGPA